MPDTLKQSSICSDLLIPEADSSHTDIHVGLSKYCHTKISWGLAANILAAGRHFFPTYKHK